MEKEHLLIAAINDAATFIKTSEETNGEYTLIEIDLGKSDGPPLHYHNAFSEKFQVSEGVLYLQVGKEKKILNSGESVTVPAGTPHRFYNETSDQVKFLITLKPGHTGMENFIKIFYGLASDGLTDKKGKPKNFAHLAVALIMSIQMLPGSCHFPIIRNGKRSKRNGRKMVADGIAANGPELTCS
jgi:quercetin dioxygenase-like cupin family protein